MVSIDHLLSSDEKAKLVSKLNMLSEMKAVPGGPPRSSPPFKTCCVFGCNAWPDTSFLHELRRYQTTLPHATVP